MRIFVKDQASGQKGLRPGGACEKNNHPVEVPGQAGICIIFRGLFFEHNTAIGQKEYLWMDTN